MATKKEAGSGAKKNKTQDAKPNIPVIHPRVLIADDSLKNTTRETQAVLSRKQEKIYRAAISAMNKAGVLYAVGASFARHIYTSIWRPTKDLDIFVRPDDLKTTLDILEQAGFRTEVVNDHWLAKAWKDDYFIDIIFGHGHGQIRITDESFVGSKKAEIFGVETNLFPIEEMIAGAAYIATRGRFDGGEIVHLIRKTKGKLDWQRIVDRLGENKQLLLWHLILFDFVYPGHSNYLPQDLMVSLFKEIRSRWKDAPIRSKAFRGMLLDPYSFNVDIMDWGYKDARNLDPLVDQEGDML